MIIQIGAYFHRPVKLFVWKIYLTVTNNIQFMLKQIIH